jgi:tetratricopeptide repeat protein 8
MGMFREAQTHFRYQNFNLGNNDSKTDRLSLQHQEMTSTIIDLGKVFLRIDQPNSALDAYQQGLHSQPGETQQHLAVARVYQALNDLEKASEFFRKVTAAELISIYFLLTPVLSSNQSHVF